MLSPVIGFNIPHVYTIVPQELYAAQYRYKLAFDDIFPYCIETRCPIRVSYFGPSLARVSAPVPHTHTTYVRRPFQIF